MVIINPAGRLMQFMSWRLAGFIQKSYELAKLLAKFRDVLNAAE